MDARLYMVGFILVVLYFVWWRYKRSRKTLKEVHVSHLRGLHSKNVDWTRYAGKWYERERIDSWFEPRGLKEVTAEYTPLQETLFRVHNHGVRPYWWWPFSSDAYGTAKMTTLPGTLDVSFFPFVSSSYVVLDINEDYSKAIVGTPNRHQLWALDRAPPTGPALEYDHEHVLEVARRNAYPDSTLEHLHAL